MSEEKRYNGVDVMSNVTGLPKEAIREMWEEVKKNSQTLKDCPRPHDFEIDMTITVRRATCRTCGGVLDKLQAMSYMEGLADSRLIQ